jgi:hypothetical protein
MRFLILLIHTLGLLSYNAGAQAATVTFDDMAPACSITEAAPLTTRYSALGVTFSGSGGPPPVVMSACSGYNGGASSGSNFLVADADATGSPLLTFAGNVTNLSLEVNFAPIYYAPPSYIEMPPGAICACFYSVDIAHFDTIAFSFFDEHGALLARYGVMSFGFSPLVVSTGDLVSPFRSVAISSPAEYFTVNRISFELARNEQFSTLSGAVPEPASWVMMMLGFGMAGCALRGRARVHPSFA